MTRRTLLLTSLLVLAAHGIPAAQAPAGPAGHWEGAIEVPGQALAIEVDLAAKDGTWMGIISILPQNLKGFQLSEVVVYGTSVGFVMKGVPGEPSFKGTLSADGKAIAGDFSQGGGTLPFTLAWKGDARFPEKVKSTPITKDVEGAWEGALDVQGKVLRLTLTLTNHAEGATGMLVSVDQGGVEIPVSSVVQDGPKLALGITLVNGGWVGELKDAELVGTWTQGPGSLPLTFRRPAK